MLHRLMKRCQKLIADVESPSLRRHATKTLCDLCYFSKEWPCADALIFPLARIVDGEVMSGTHRFVRSARAFAING